MNESWRLGTEKKSAGMERAIRQGDWILMLLFAGGRKQRYNEPIAGRIRLMKELFLFHMRFQKIDTFYKFRAYKYGPYSDEIQHDLMQLCADGLIQTASGFGSEVYSLTPTGLNRARFAYDALDSRLRQGLVDTKIRYNLMALHELLALVYERYPAFAANSEYEGPPVE